MRSKPSLKAWLGTEDHLKTVAPFGFDKDNLTTKTAAELCGQLMQRSERTHRARHFLRARAHSLRKPEHWVEPWANYYRYCYKAPGSRSRSRSTDPAGDCRRDPRRSGRMSPWLPVRWFSIAYIELFRGTSLLVQLFWLFFVLPLPPFNIEMSPFAVAIVGLGLHIGAYGAEVMRGAISSVAKGQYEASVALNFTAFTRFRRIILPQALLAAIPPGDQPADRAAEEHLAGVADHAVGPELPRAPARSGDLRRPCRSSPLALSCISSWHS
jgi:His/Glu/Gln/Arg/opine family amino acid ABC transporter permease subunit